LGTWQLRSRQILSIPSSPILAISLGTKMCTEPRIPVPKLEGQQVMQPRTGSCTLAVHKERKRTEKKKKYRHKHVRQASDFLKAFLNCTDSYENKSSSTDKQSHRHASAGRHALHRPLPPCYKSRVFHPHNKAPIPDDSQMITLINPKQKRLSLVVENSSTLRPRQTILRFTSSSRDQCSW